jgi:hypothetical protein
MGFDGRGQRGATTPARLPWDPPGGAAGDDETFEPLDALLATHAA